MSDGKLSYMQIPALDAEVSSAFYRDVFGWEVRGTPEHRSFSDKSGELIGAFVTEREIAGEPGILPYIYVDGIDAAITRIYVTWRRGRAPTVPRGRPVGCDIPRPGGKRAGRLAAGSALDTNHQSPVPR